MFAALALVVALVPAPASGASAVARAGVVEPWTCPFVLPAPEVEGETYACGRVAVPFDPAAPDGATISLAFAVLRATGPTAAADAALWLEGGPGASALIVADATLLMVAGVRAERDVVLFDQRGAGYSGYLDCGAQKSAAVQALIATGGWMPLPPAADASIAEVFDYALGTAALGLDACRADYDAVGRDLRLFRTGTIAADGFRLLDALGYARATLWGTSYGGRVAQEMARQQPDRVRAMVLDSPLPLEVRRLATFATLESEPFAALVAACAADPGCDAAYPDLGPRALALIAALDAAPHPVAPDRAAAAGLADGRLAGEAVVRLLTAVLPARPDLAAWMPRALADLERGDATVALAILAGEFPAPPSDIPTSLADTDFAALRDPTDARLALSLAMRSVVICNDEAADITLAAIAAEAAREDASAPITSVPLRSAVTLYAQCKALGLSREEPLAVAPVASGVPLLVLVGAFDATTVPSWGALAARNGGGTLVVLPLSGHAAVRDSACARLVATAFVAAPDATLPTGCLAEEAPVFALPDAALPTPLAADGRGGRQ